MKFLSHIILVLIFGSPTLLSNGGPPPPPPLFKAKNAGPVYQAPLITSKNESGFFANLSYTAVSELDGRIDLEGTNTNLSGIVNDQNFEWETPAIQFNVGSLLKFSQGAGLILNLGYYSSNSTGNISFETAYTGMLLNEENNKVRFSIGICFHALDFIWYTDSSYYIRKAHKIDYDPTISLAYNTDFKDWLFNPFLQLSYSTQTLFDDNTDEFNVDVYKNVNVYTLTPGLNYNINDNVLLSLGLSFAYIHKIENSSSFAFLPKIQFMYYL